MPPQLFQVQLRDLDAGSDRWVTLTADSAKDASLRAAKLGYSVGFVNHLRLSPSLASASPDRLARLSELGAILMSIIGALILPFAVVGVVWGCVLLAITQGRRGATPVAGGIFAAVIQFGIISNVI